jgi:hypothetical protein
MFIPDTAISAVVTTALFTAIAFILVVLRTISRVNVVKNVGVDDYLMIAAMVSANPELDSLIWANHGNIPTP